MNRIHLSLVTSISFALAMGTVACDLEKEGMDTGASDEDIEDDAGGKDDSVTTAGTGEDDGDDTGEDTGEDDGEMSTSAGGEDDGDDDDSAGTGEDDSDGEDTGSGGGEMSAFAMSHADLPDLDDGGADTGGSGDDGEGDLPDDALHVFISGSGAKTCEMPYESEPCGGNWSVSFTLLPEMQAPGSYSLLDEANGFQSYADEPHPEGDCAWGGGSLDGVLVIEAITDEAIVGHIEGSDAFDFDADMDFYAELCG